MAPRSPRPRPQGPIQFKSIHQHGYTVPQTASASPPIRQSPPHGDRKGPPISSPQHGDRKGPPIPTQPPSPLLYTGLAAPTGYSSGEGGAMGMGGPLRSPCGGLLTQLRRRSHSGLSMPSLLSKPQRQTARLNRTNTSNKMMIVNMMLSLRFDVNGVVKPMVRVASRASLRRALAFDPTAPAGYQASWRIFDRSAGFAAGVSPPALVVRILLVVTIQLVAHGTCCSCNRVIRDDLQILTMP